MLVGAAKNATNTNYKYWPMLEGVPQVERRTWVAFEFQLAQVEVASWQTAKAANFDKSVLAKGLKSLDQLNMPCVVGRQTQMLFEYTCKGLKSLDQLIS